MTAHGDQGPPLTGAGSATPLHSHKLKSTYALHLPTPNSEEAIHFSSAVNTPFQLAGGASI